MISNRSPILRISSEAIFQWVCIAPVLVFLIVVAVAPTAVAIVDSLRNLALTSFSQRGEFLGLDNYRELLGGDAKFFTALWHTVVFVLIVVPIEFAAGLAIALLLDREFKGRRLVITFVMVPTVIAPVVVALIWFLLFLPTFGILTQYMNELGLFRSTGVFSDPITAFGAIALIDIWEWTPFVTLLMLAGLSAMPKEPIEAATLDGASRWQILRHVQLPLLKSLIVIVLMLRTIDASKVFDTVFVLTGGGPGDSTEMLSTFAYRTNFMSWNLGYGAAICLVIAFASLVVAAAFYKIVSRQSERSTP
ncbi:MAG: sugar ABC transporter permease [Gammaproteobacteria bacterium]|nr:sugar ABC transporter permease [Gammaproteobacteria bacterium]